MLLCIGQVESGTEASSHISWAPKAFLRSSCGCTCGEYLCCVWAAVEKKAENTEHHVKRLK